MTEPFTITIEHIRHIARELAKPDPTPILVALPDGRFVPIHEIGVVHIEITEGQPQEAVLLVTEGAMSLNEMEGLITSSEAGQN